MAHRARLSRSRTRNESTFPTSSSSRESNDPPNARRLPFPRTAAAGELSPIQVFQRITHLIDHVTEQIRNGETPYVDVPDLHANNAIYDDRGNLSLGSGTRRISLHDTMAFMRLLLTLELAHDIVPRGTYVTKRGLFYHHQTKLPDKHCEQNDSDRALTALANVLEVRRKTLGFIAARRGTIYGSLIVREGGQVFDVSRMSVAGWAAPGLLDDLQILESKAKFVLLVEKHAIAVRLAQSRWCETHPCIVVCSEGFPSLSTRELARQLVSKLRVPVYALADGDPWGIRVALAHAHGSIGAAMETPWLVCDDVQWAGFYPSDFERFGLSSFFGIQLTEDDVNATKLLLDHRSHEHVNRSVRKELGILLESGFKVELDALVAKDVEYLAREYLPRKLFETDLIKL